ncbi:MAG: cell division ATP-binding protein FtsE [Candidatus Staskawiczbacteria bacterium RIFOXYD1_FULL_39_28]|uniref:Cell division ATP-binding protein FtsE n=1 Tax=Candidatus Staskawiczbacteria bacterium RIFOXYC1_FULL_38_18 TaxID=1802229 RepID=A0A1G2JGD6_9BACT|nr:MAG: cell division ATP-binding protein FtsE [Candidatus Staskawiczbacteria bacterium RIFOXYC1_FULL_38_18]OGZ92497.1 MAG: cell division ATP-binding protein FtsE [Candidatus Staskawiczbacteria bacterium RIFOXYD1_FULL_39_28]
MIRFENVSKIYQDNAVVLSNISFEIKEGEFVSIVGKSGAGKTTLLRLILGLENPTSGEVYFKGMNVKDMDSLQLQEVRRKIGGIFQDYRLLSAKTVYENVAYVMQVEGKENREIDEEVPKVLEVIGIKDKINNFPSELSGGEQQRLAIARALVNHPEIIIADEPTGNLDPYNSYEVVSLLRKIHQTGRTVILSTHDREVINKLGQRVITLENGRIIRDEAEGKFII